jgi:hypothetical protein
MVKTSRVRVMLTRPADEPALLDLQHCPPDMRVSRQASRCPAASRRLITAAATYLLLRRSRLQRRSDSRSLPVEPAKKKGLGMEALESCGGGEEEDRTPDLRIANATLSQLSYPPTTDRILAHAEVAERPLSPKRGRRASGVSC